MLVKNVTCLSHQQTLWLDKPGGTQEMCIFDQHHGDYDAVVPAPLFE